MTMEVEVVKVIYIYYAMIMERQMVLYNIEFWYFLFFYLIVCNSSVLERFKY